MSITYLIESKQMMDNVIFGGVKLYCVNSERPWNAKIIAVQPNRTWFSVVFWSLCKIKNTLTILPIKVRAHCHGIVVQDIVFVSIVLRNSKTKEPSCVLHCLKHPDPMPSSQKSTISSLIWSHHPFDSEHRRGVQLSGQESANLCV